MKNFLLVMIMVMLTMTTMGQSAAYTWAGTGSYTVTATPVGTFPLFGTKIDTVAAAAVDSFKEPLHSHYGVNAGWGDVNSILYTLNVWKVNTTTVNPTVTLALYRSGNFGTTYETTPVYTVAVTPTSSNSVTPVSTLYYVNPSKGGNPASDYIWQATGSASSTFSRQNQVLIR